MTTPPPGHLTWFAGRVTTLDVARESPPLALTPADLDPAADGDMIRTAHGLILRRTPDGWGIPDTGWMVDVTHDDLPATIYTATARSGPASR